jgi:hypothetical protein
MPASKRILNWDLSAGKPEPLIEAEAVITLFYYMRTVAPQVWSDLIDATATATTQADFVRSVAAWAVAQGFCGPTGPTQWALLIGIPTAKSIRVPKVKSIFPGTVVNLLRDGCLLLPISSESTYFTNYRRLISAARRLLIGIESAKARFFGTVPNAPPKGLCILHLHGDHDRSSSNRPHRYASARWCFTLYRRSIRNKFAALKGGCPVTTRPLDIAVEFAERLIWSPATDPAGNELMDKVSTAIEELRQRFKAAISPMVSGEQPTTDRDRIRNIIWFIRHTIGGTSFTKIGQTADKFLENESGYYPAECDRGTVARGICLAAHELGVIVRPADRGGRPVGRKGTCKQ